MSPASDLIILGIDPGYERCGVAIVQKKNGPEILLASDCLITSAKQPYAERLLLIGSGVESLIKKWQPNLLAIEKVFFANNQKTAGQIGEVRGVLLYLAAKYNLLISEFTPLQIKQTVASHGGADKRQVATMVRRLIKLKQEPKYDDEWDAIAAALTGAAFYPQLGGQKIAK